MHWGSPKALVSCVMVANAWRRASGAWCVGYAVACWPSGLENSRSLLERAGSVENGIAACSPAGVKSRKQENSLVSKGSWEASGCSSGCSKYPVRWPGNFCPLPEPWGLCGGGGFMWRCPCLLQVMVFLPGMAERPWGMTRTGVK